MKKQYFKKGEKVWVKSEKKAGIVKELIINPNKKEFKAEVEIKVDENTKLNKKVELKDLEKTFGSKNHTPRPTILIAKTRYDAVIPSKENEDAGYDVYACFEEDEVVIMPNEVAMIGTGIATSITDDWVLVVKERGSTGTKAMSVRAGIIDSSFRGEIFVPINNTSDKRIVITKSVDQVEKHEDRILYPYSKAIAQMLLLPVPKTNIKEISYEDLQKIPSKRGTGALGSSNK
jgi:dUTP pyrophosphatase